MFCHRPSSTESIDEQAKRIIKQTNLMSSKTVSKVESRNSFLDSQNGKPRPSRQKIIIKRMSENHFGQAEIYKELVNIADLKGV